MTADHLRHSVAHPAKDSGAEVRVWRPEGRVDVVVLHRRSRCIRAELHGEYMFTHVADRAVSVVRGRDRDEARPGELLLWGPRGVNHGTAVDSGIWESRGLVIELPVVAEVINDPEGCMIDLELPHPVCRDQARAAMFLRLLDVLRAPPSILERDVTLARWLRELSAFTPASRRQQRQEKRRSARHDPGFRRACELLHDSPNADVDLATLANAADTSKFRLLRLFNAALGLPPHHYQLQLRIQRARALLEAGRPAAAVAHELGFFDQSHLTRHFQRRLGVTPGAYAKAVQAGRAGGPCVPIVADGEDAEVA